MDHPPNGALPRNAPIQSGKAGLDSEFCFAKLHSAGPRPAAFAGFGFIFALLLILVLTLSGCGGAEGRLLVMQGNFQAARGQHTRATVLYMQALDRPESAPYAEYALGNTFFTLDEAEAALSRFAEAQRLLDEEPSGLHRELRYRNHYNRGIALFSRADFEGAAAAFRNALRAVPGRPQAMRNLELSLLSQERRPPESEGDNGNGNSEALETTFRYLMQREARQWENRQWPEEESIPGDDR